MSGAAEVVQAVLTAQQVTATQEQRRAAQHVFEQVIGAMEPTSWARLAAAQAGRRAGWKRRPFHLWHQRLCCETDCTLTASTNALINPPFDALPALLPWCAVEAWRGARQRSGGEGADLAGAAARGAGARVHPDAAPGGCTLGGVQC